VRAIEHGEATRWNPAAGGVCGDFAPLHTTLRRLSITNSARGQNCSNRRLAPVITLRIEQPRVNQIRESLAGAPGRARRPQWRATPDETTLQPDTPGCPHRPVTRRTSVFAYGTSRSLLRIKRRTGVLGSDLLATAPWEREARARVIALSCPDAVDDAPQFQARSCAQALVETGSE
jgi:hypothetical protein